MIFLSLCLILFNFSSIQSSTPTPTLTPTITTTTTTQPLYLLTPPQQGCDQQCITNNLHARLLLRAHSDKCCGETIALRLGTFQTLGMIDLQRQVDLAFGYSTSITYQTNATTTTTTTTTTQQQSSLSSDLDLIHALSSLTATKIWLHKNMIPLAELTVFVHEIPTQAVGLAFGGEHVSKYIWQLASRHSGDPLAKVDVRIDKLLLGSIMSKEDVGIEIPRGGRVRSLDVPAVPSLPLGPDSHVLSSFPISPHRVVLGVVIDASDQKYLRQGLRWLTSLKETMMSKSTETTGMHLMKVLICVLPNVPEQYKARLRTEFSFVDIREIRPLSETLPGATPHSNKLRFLEQKECQTRTRTRTREKTYHVCVYFDTDILLLNGDFLSYLLPEGSEPTVQFRAGRTLWAQTASNDPAWHRIFELAGVMRNKRDGFTLASKWPNTGVLIFPVSLVPEILYEWMHYTDKTLKWLIAMKQDVYFTETISFLLTILMMPTVKYELLPIQANCQMNLPRFDFVRNGYDRSLQLNDVTVLHYPLDTMLMDEFYVPHKYDVETILQFPFLTRVNDRIERLRWPMTRTMTRTMTAETAETVETVETAEAAAAAAVAAAVAAAAAAAEAGEKRNGVDTTLDINNVLDNVMMDVNVQAETQVLSSSSTSIVVHLLVLHDLPTSSASSLVSSDFQSCHVLLDLRLPFSLLLSKILEEINVRLGLNSKLFWVDSEQDLVDVVSPEDLMDSMKSQRWIAHIGSEICSSEISKHGENQQERKKATTEINRTLRLFVVP